MSTGLDLGIDKLQLDEEWVNQPRLFLQWSEKAADAARAYDETKRELALTAAEVANAIRQNPQSYGLEKTTEASISAAVLMQKEYQQAERAVVVAKHHKDLIDGAVEALRQRKSALQDLVTLFICGYFAEPRAPKMAKEMMDEAQDRVRRVRGVKVQADEDW